VGASCILQKMSFQHCMSDKDMPLTFVLVLENFHKVFAKKRGLEHFLLQCFGKEGDYRISPGSR